MHLAYFTAAILSISAPGDAARTGETVLLDFRADWCGPCRQMDPVVSQLIAAGYPVRRVNVDQERAFANRFDLRKGIPCFVLLVNGQEVDRIVGVTGRQDLEEMFRRNGVGPGVTAARGQSPDPRAQAKSVPFPPTDRHGLLAGNLRGGAAAPATAVEEIPSSPRQSDQLPTVPVSYDKFAPEGALPSDRLVRATVRLRIEDDHGNSVGSGTIIDARQGEALIVTCGHVFRDAIRGGHIWVDLFGPDAPQGVAGKLIDFDLKSEVGLLRIRTSYPVTVARLAPVTGELRQGDRVISLGCDGGADPTPRPTQVTSINRYLGAPNLQVAFQPVQGRSGGGLFTPDGLLVGVCYAADPEAGEGLFASLPALQSELDNLGLAFIYRDGANRRRAPDENSAPRGQAVSSQNLAAVGPERGLPRNDLSITPTSARIDQPAPPLSPDEQATLAALREKSQNAEMICIFRSLGNPQAKSEIVVVDRASPAFIQQLTGTSAAATPRSAAPANPLSDEPRVSWTRDAAPTAPMQPAGAGAAPIAPAARW